MIVIGFCNDILPRKIARISFQPLCFAFQPPAVTLRVTDMTHGSIFFLLPGPSLLCSGLAETALHVNPWGLHYLIMATADSTAISQH